jgi:dTDP-4-amino-4,6-dideoxygalactose transaminase
MQINVTKTFLPPLEEYNQYLKSIWDSSYVTNRGPLVLELEKKLRDYLGVKNLLFVSNGTIALQIAIKALNLSGEIITTPFSYVATTTSIIWENCTPIFVDIEPNTYCIDASKIEDAITAKTSAILATHVYGYPCDVEAIESIANKYNLKVIYDGAHAFGTRVNGKSLLDYGDVSTLSFHATKLFHTIEGGAIIARNDDVARKILLYHQFGHVYDEYFSMGINGKNSEFHAAMGLCLYPLIDDFIAKRRYLISLYDSLLLSLGIKRPICDDNVEYNAAYYPVLFPDESTLLFVKDKLGINGINTRRYFFPSLNTLPYIIHSSAPISENIASRVLCLPLFYELQNDQVIQICEIIRNCFVNLI